MPVTWPPRPTSISAPTTAATGARVGSLLVLLLLFGLLSVLFATRAIADEGASREAIARELSLAKNFPNPFNANTEIVYTLLRPARVKVDVYDLAGRHVAELIHEQQDTGKNFAIWKTEHDPSGTYIFRVEVEGIQVFRKMSMVK